MGFAALYPSYELRFTRSTDRGFEAMQTRSDLADKCRAMIAAGTGEEDLLIYLRAEGGSKIDSIAVLVDVLKITLADAKRLVHCSRTWSDVRQRDDEFHDQLFEADDERGKMAPPQSNGIT